MIYMKHRIRIAMLMLLLIFVLASCAVSDSVDAESGSLENVSPTSPVTEGVITGDEPANESATANINQDYLAQYLGESQYDEIIACRIDIRLYREFIANPSIELLENSDDLLSYRISEENEEHIEEWDIRSESKIRTEESGLYYICNTAGPITTALIDFAGNIDAYLLENNINASIDRCLLIFCDSQRVSNIPLTFWVRTSAGDFFITIEGAISNYYELYTHEAYYEKYRQKEGKLFVNGEDITQGNYVVFEHEGVYLPLVEIMEALDVAMEWVEDENKFIIEYGVNRLFLVLYDRAAMLTNENGHRVVSSPILYQFIDNQIVVDNWAMADFASFVEAELKIDYEELTVYIDFDSSTSTTNNIDKAATDLPDNG